MKFPLSWLKEYIDIELPPQEIAKLLTFAGIEVDSMERAGLSFDKVVVGEVLSTEPHPNADKLTVAKVTDGTETYQVVCGAPNCKAGMRTALALLGATIHFAGGEVLKIKRSKIRGVESFGMLCAGDELGISSEADGILEFAPHMPLGKDLSEIYSDTIFEVSLTPNLCHAASILGIARELSAASGLPLKMPLIFLKEEEKKTSAEVKVQIDAADLCPRYGCRVVEGFVNGESPLWMKKRLIASGQRPLNLAADITNYVLLELGHPLHAFDRAKITGNALIVRKAKNGESIQTLDGKMRTLQPEMLVIADTEKPLAVAGVMGGENSEASPATTQVWIEAAYFNPGSIRRTSKLLGLSTEASKRFERGVDPNGIEMALDRAAMLFQEAAQAKILKGNLIQSSQEFPEKVILCRLERINALLGTRLGLSEVEEMFSRLAFKTDWDGKEAWKVKVPTYRVDIAIEVDLIEEIARMVGYENIPRPEATLHTSQLTHTPLFEFEREVRRRLIAEGLQEFLTCDLIGPTILSKVPEAKMPKDAVVQVLNPTSIEQSILRASLLQGLLEVVKYNVDHENRNLGGFEVGKVHFKTEGKYCEPLVLGLVMMGKSRPYHLDPPPGDVDFYDLKGVIENVLEGLNIKRFSFRQSHLSTFHSGRQATIQVDGEDVGTLGEIHPAILRNMDLTERVYFAEVNLEDLYRAKRGALKMRPVPSYPASERDWTVTVKEQIPVQQLISSIQHIPSTLLESVSLVDLFRSEKLGPHHKNVTLHFVYRDPKKTVEQHEVDLEHARIISTAEQMLG
jgi:phenylalanyl-tRNA synthetase beta chain